MLGSYTESLNEQTNHVRKNIWHEKYQYQSAGRGDRPVVLVFLFLNNCF